MDGWTEEQVEELLAKRKDDAGAEKHYRQAIKLDPELPMVHDGLEALLLKQREASEQAKRVADSLLAEEEAKAAPTKPGKSVRKKAAQRQKKESKAEAQQRRAKQAEEEQQALAEKKREEERAALTRKIEAERAARRVLSEGHLHAPALGHGSVHRRRVHD